MRIKYMVPAGSIDEVDDIILSEISPKAQDRIRLVVDMLPAGKTYIAKIEVVREELIKSHHIKNGSIAIIEKCNDINEGEVFVDREMNILQFMKNGEFREKIKQAIESDKYSYKLSDKAKDLWGIIRLIINPGDEPE